MFSLIQNGNHGSQYVPYPPSQVQPTTPSSTNDTYGLTTLYVLSYPI